MKTFDEWLQWTQYYPHPPTLRRWLGAIANKMHSMQEWDNYYLAYLGELAQRAGIVEWIPEATK